MKDEPSLNTDELCQEDKDLIKFLREKGYDRVFRLNRAFAVLEYTKFKVRDYDKDALKVILLLDPGMAEPTPDYVWNNRQEVYITGNKFGLAHIVTVVYDGIEKILERRVLAGKSREDWR